MKFELYNFNDESVYSKEVDPLKFNIMRELRNAETQGVKLSQVDICLSIDTLNKNNNIKVERIMVVDDDEIQRANYKELLARCGHYIEIFEAAEPALEFFQKDPSRFTAVFTDNNMGEMSGSQLAKLIKKTNPHVKVYILTGQLIGVDDDIFDSDIEASISKPVTMNTFQGTIGMAHSNKVQLSESEQHEIDSAVAEVKQRLKVA